MKIERFKSDETIVDGSILSTLVGKIVFESEEPMFEDPNMHGNEQFVRAVINNNFDNGAEPFSTITLIRGDVHNSYRLWFEGSSIKVSDADKISDTALLTVMPWVSSWFNELVAEALEVARSESIAISESISTSESISLSEWEEFSESISVSVSNSLSASTSESLSLSESESLSFSTSESISLSQWVSESESLVISEVHDSYNVSMSLLSQSMSMEYLARSEKIESTVASLITRLGSLSDDFDSQFESSSLTGSESAELLIQERLSGLASEEVSESELVLSSEHIQDALGISSESLEVTALLDESETVEVSTSEFDHDKSLIDSIYIVVSESLSTAEVEAQNTAELEVQSELNDDEVFDSLSASLHNRVHSETATGVFKPRRKRKRSGGWFDFWRGGSSQSASESESLNENFFQVSQTQVASDDSDWVSPAEDSEVKTHVRFRSEEYVQANDTTSEGRKLKQFTVGSEGSKVKVLFEE